MAANSSDREENNRVGLRTRHVFLDTEVYRGHEHDLSSAPFRIFADLIEEDRVVLHMTDITLDETARHVRDQAAEIERNANELLRKIGRWRDRFPRSNPPKLAEVKGSELATVANQSFTWRILCEWHAQNHEALNCPPREIFDRYFNRNPPFDKGNSKEFPDAFVVATLANWCKKNNSTMYIVTRDQAMQRAASETGVLLPVSSLQELLEIASEAETPEIIAVVESVIDAPEFLDHLRKHVEENIGELGLVYSGDLAEGEVLEAVVSGEPVVQKFSVIQASQDTLGVILTAQVPLEVTVEFEDRSSAMYDREDDMWYFTEQGIIEFEDEATMRIYVEFEKPNMSITEMDILTKDLHLSEPYEDYN